MKQLSNRNVPSRITRPIKIIQFGAGNFLRAFIDWFVEILNEQTDFNGDIAVVKPTGRGDYKNLREQDGLYHVLLNGFKSDAYVHERKLITCLQQIVNPYKDWNAYLKLAENPDIRFVVSNTTEAGIKFNTDDGFKDTVPHEFPAKLTRWLYHRFDYFEADPSKACIILPLELVEQNGVFLKSCILQYSSLWNLGDKFMRWVELQIFCDTVVDRIVSGYPKKMASSIQDELGLFDGLLVVGEWYHSWIIQAPESVSQELPFSKTDLNVKFVKDLDIYRKIKVRILNGSHTSLVPVGYLHGVDYVNEAMEHEVVGPFIEQAIYDEICPTLDVEDIEIENFVSETLERFRNPSLQHALLSISLNSISKFKTRLLPSMLKYKQIKGNWPPKLVFAFASLLAFYRGEMGAKIIQLSDDKKVLEFFNIHWQNNDGSKKGMTSFVKSVLGNKSFWDQDLSKNEELVEDLATHLLNIYREGIDRAIQTVF